MSLLVAGIDRCSESTRGLTCGSPDREPDRAQAHAGHGQNRISTTRQENHVSYTITARFADGRIEKNEAAGRLVALINAAYDRGALGVTAIIVRTPAANTQRTAPL